jgi:serine/threonine protein kinase
VEFKSYEREPLHQLRFLGQGLNGSVYETKCKGVSLAWKKKFRRKGIGERERREISIMKKLNHHHIAKIAGTYSLGKFFGMLIWPVAVCDLATLLEDLEHVKRQLVMNLPEDIKDEEVLDRFQALGLPVEKGLTDLHMAITRRLMRSMGCLTNAVTYFHEMNIKHKDLKPSNVLLARGGGLWITDFECSTDFSFLTSSVTEEGERGTPKYFAPEVAARQPCSRPADIFALGCIFLEMLWVTETENTLESLRSLRPQEDSLLHCSFQHNLDHRHEWLGGLPKQTALDRHLSFEIIQMLSPSPDDRPTASDLKIFLQAIETLSVGSTEPLLHSACCASQRKPPDETVSQQVDEVKSGFPTDAISDRTANPEGFPHAFERWEALSSHWEGLTSFWIQKLEQNHSSMQQEPLTKQLAQQVTDLSAAGANLFHAVVELQRLRASSERKFQRWFFETRQEREENLEQRAVLQHALQHEKTKRKVAEENLRTLEANLKILEATSVATNADKMEV